MARQAFKLYDRSGTGEITVEGIAAFLTDLGVFGDDPAEVAKSKEEVRQHFQMADKNNDGRIAFDEFLIMYNRILNNDAMANKVGPLPPLSLLALNCSKSKAAYPACCVSESSTNSKRMISSSYKQRRPTIYDAVALIVCFDMDVRRSACYSNRDEVTSRRSTRRAISTQFSELLYVLMES